MCRLFPCSGNRSLTGNAVRNPTIPRERPIVALRLTALTGLTGLTAINAGHPKMGPNALLAIGMRHHAKLPTLLFVYRCNVRGQHIDAHGPAFDPFASGKSFRAPLKHPAVRERSRY